MTKDSEPLLEPIEINSEIVSLAPDNSKTWGRVLRLLREKGEHMLHAAAAEINDIEFMGDEIRIYCPNQALFTLLAKYKNRLNELAGSNIITILPPAKGSKRTERIEKLKELFGEKLVVK